MNFSEQLIAYRRANGLSQKDLAEKLGTTQQNVQYLEAKGEVKVKTKQEIEKILGDGFNAILKPKLAYDNSDDVETYKRNAAIYKEKYEHCLRMVELLGGVA